MSLITVVLNQNEQNSIIIGFSENSLIALHNTASYDMWFVALGE